MYCKFCNKVFASSYGLKTHEATHAGKRENTENDIPYAISTDEDVPYRCRICFENFPNLSVLEQHREQCGVLLASGDGPPAHIGQENVETTSSVNTIRTFGASVEIDIPDNELPVEKIASINTRPVNRQRPTRTSPDLKCNECGEDFLTYAQWRKHKRKHVTKKCDDCGRVFGRATNMKRHKAGMKKYRCETCGKCFGSKSCMSYHRKNTDCRGDSKIVEFCDPGKKGKVDEVKSSVQLESVNQEAGLTEEADFTEVAERGDAEVVTPQKEFSSKECSECRAILKDNDSFSYHTKSRNSGEKSKCRYCEKWFTGKPCLIYHEITHIKYASVAVEDVNHDHRYSSQAIRPPTLGPSCLKFANRPRVPGSRADSSSPTAQQQSDVVDTDNNNTLPKRNSTACTSSECDASPASDEDMQKHKRDHVKRQSVASGQMVPCIVTESRSAIDSVAKPDSRKRQRSRWIPIAPKVVKRTSKPAFAAGTPIQIEERDGKIIICDGVQNIQDNTSNIEIEPYASQEIPCDPVTGEAHSNRVFPMTVVPKFMILKFGGKSKKSRVPTQTKKPKNTVEMPRRLLPKGATDKLPSQTPKGNMVSIQGIVPGQLVKSNIGGVRQFFRFDPTRGEMIPMTEQPNTKSTVPNIAQSSVTPIAPRFTLIKVDGKPQGTRADAVTQSHNQRNTPAVPRTLFPGGEGSPSMKPSASTNNTVTIPSIAPGQIIKINIGGADQLFRHDPKSKSMVPLPVTTRQSCINHTEVNQAAQNAIYSICVDNAHANLSGQDNPEISSDPITGKDANPVQVEEPNEVIDNACETVKGQNNPEKIKDPIIGENVKPVQLEEQSKNVIEFQTSNNNNNTDVSDAGIPESSSKEVLNSSKVDNGKSREIPTPPVAPKLLVVQVDGKAQAKGGDTQTHNMKKKNVFVIPKTLLSQRGGKSVIPNKSSETIQSAENALTMQNIAAGQVIKITVEGTHHFFRFDPETRSMVPVTVTTQQPKNNQVVGDVNTNQSRLRWNNKKAKKDMVPQIHECSVCHKVLSSLGALKEHEHTHSANRASYECNLCEKTFISKSGFKRHLVRHSNLPEEKTKCDICDKQLASLSSLRDHKRTIHGTRKMVKCDSCDKEFTSLTGLKYHQRTHTGTKRQYSCDECGKSFTGTSGLKYHKQQEDGDTDLSFKCATCNKEFTNKACLKHHEKSHDAKAQLMTKFDKCEKESSSPSDLKYEKITYANGKRVFKCDECDKVLPSISSVEIHKGSHTQNKFLYKCDVCDKELSNSRALKYHKMAIHDKERPWKCDQCPKAFIFKNLYNAHKKEHNIDFYKCEFCNKVSKTASAHKYHVKLHTKIGVFTCGVCDKIFVQNQHFERHMSIHSSGTPLPCHFCTTSFSTKYDLKLHLKTHKNDKYKYKCDLCDKVYTQRSTLKDHHMRSHSNEPIKCTICDKEFTKLHRFKVHKLEHRGCSFKCDVCGKMLSSKGSLQDHKMMHSGVKPHTCDVCGRAFIKKVYLIYHKATHSTEGRKTYECDVCGKVIASLQSLKCHKMLHTGVLPHQCDKCGMKFNRASALKNHRRRKHFNDGRHKCDVCGKVLLDAASLRNHKVLHTGIKRFKCTICERAFFNRSAMKKHVDNNHTASRNADATKMTTAKKKVQVEKLSEEFVCCSCGKVLATKEALKQHEERHATRSFKCDKCGIEFIKESSYLFHLKIHSGKEQPFKCKICHKVVMSAYSLRQHYRIHSDVKAYKCDKCPQRFRQKSCLTNHQLVHDPETKYQCTVCLATLRTLRSLRLHREAMHSEKRPYECEECGKGWVKRHLFLKHQKWHRGEKPYACDLCNEAFMTRIKYKTHRDTVHNKLTESGADNADECYPQRSDLNEAKTDEPNTDEFKPNESDPGNLKETVPKPDESITDESMFQVEGAVPFLDPIEDDLSELLLETNDVINMDKW